MKIIRIYYEYNLIYLYLSALQRMLDITLAVNRLKQRGEWLKSSDLSERVIAELLIKEIKSKNWQSVYKPKYNLRITLSQCNLLSRKAMIWSDWPSFKKY